MILGEPTLQSVIDYVVAEGCPECGNLPGWLDVVSPNEIVLEGCGHVADVRRWIAIHHQDGDLNRNELHEEEP